MQSVPGKNQVSIEELPGSLKEPHAQSLQEMQFLHPRQLTLLSLPFLSGMMVVPPGLEGKHRTG